MKSGFALAGAITVVASNAVVFLLVPGWWPMALVFSVAILVLGLVLDLVYGRGHDRSR